MDAEKDKTNKEEVQEAIQRIRMTLRGREVKPLEHACSEIISRAKQQGYKTRGVVRIPTKVLTVTTRRSPCGNGTNTYDRFEMRIHKRLIDIIEPSPKTVDSLQRLDLPAGVDIEIKIQDA